MQRKNAVAFALFLILWFNDREAGLAQGDDQVLGFYCRRAAETFGSRDPLSGGVRFSIHAKTYDQMLNENGKVNHIDSSESVSYFSFGQLDSTRLIRNSGRESTSIDLLFPNVFQNQYEFYFFPNDTGGSDLSIGFDTYSSGDSSAVGFAIIDRARYFLKGLYLHYPNKQGYKRYSQCVRFVEKEGFVFPDSIWEVSARQKLFSTEFRRVETSIEEIEIYR